MSGEWSGWQGWQRYRDAGVVENNLDFSDETIIVDHAVGRTMKAIGKCWPMDAAVAYSLMKAGPNAELTWSDLVNPFTRAAAVMMTRKVAWGEVPTPGTPSCGHDEFTGCLVELGRPYVSTEQHGVSNIAFKVNTWGNRPSMDAWLTSIGVEQDDPVRSLAKFRVKGHIGGVNIEQLIATPKFAPLLDLFDEHFGNWQCQAASRVSVSTSAYRGECAWKDDSEKICLHHDRPTSPMWSLMRDGKGGFVTAYDRSSVSSGWNWNQWQGTKTSARIELQPTNMVAWDEVRRGMAAAVPESDVLAYIKKSLSRMLKRNDNIVTKQGVGRKSTHKWSDWSWLADLASQVKNTNSKKRKEGDVANGWVYTKVRARMSHGHEIADFVWHPQEEQVDYIVGRKEVEDWSAKGILTNMRFPTKAQAQEFATAIAAAHLESGGHYAFRVHEDFEKSESDEVMWQVRTINLKVVMKGVVHPEDYLSPQDLMLLMRNAAPAVIDEHRENFETLPSYVVKQAEVVAVVE